MASKLRQLRQTVVRALSDSESSKAEILQESNDSGSVPFPERAQTAPEIVYHEITSSQEDGAAMVDKFSLQDAIDQKKSDMPIRLICTEDGKLYDRNAVEDRFKTENVSFFEPGLSVVDTHSMRQAVNAWFAYAMLSHRWEAMEPLHKDLDGTDVFSLDVTSPGVQKLVHFCRAAREGGFRWAWSDTCCIDKTSTSELQKSIISMFKWYRNSDLTIVYLGDVSDDLPETLGKSVWFLRGWTLQELIAPHRLLFFKSDWTPLATSVDLPVIDNYKSSSAFRGLITEITGIEDTALTHFDPASFQPTIRQRMSWAARRKTTEIEDVAYCLMGIFDVHFPVLYGEGTSAFHRLQVEIMTKSDDTTLFDWTGTPGSNSLLASSPACFDPFTPLVVDPVPATMRLAQTLHKVPFVRQVQRGIDRLSVGLFNLQERISVNAQHPANYIAGAKIHCHGLEYIVMDVEETKVMADARESGRAVFQYHVLAESLHPLTMTLDEPIETGFGLGRIKSTYLCLFRVWDQSLATGRSAIDDGDHPLRQPFVAHLLISQPGGIYRRIRVKERIVAKLVNPMEFRLVFQLRTLMIE